MLEIRSDGFLDKKLEKLRDEVSRQAKKLSSVIDTEKPSDLGSEIRWSEEADGKINSWLIVLADNKEEEKKELAMVCKKEFWKDGQNYFCVETCCCGNGQFMYQTKNVVSLGRDDEDNLRSAESMEIESASGPFCRKVFKDGKKES